MGTLTRGPLLVILMVSLNFETGHPQPCCACPVLLLAGPAQLRRWCKQPGVDQGGYPKLGQVIPGYDSHAVASVDADGVSIFHDGKGDNQDVVCFFQLMSVDRDYHIYPTL